MKYKNTYTFPLVRCPYFYTFSYRLSIIVYTAVNGSSADWRQPYPRGGVRNYRQHGIGIEIDPSFVSAANKRLEAYENVTIYNNDLRNMEWSELPVVNGIVYCFIAWTKKYLEQFDFQQLGETIVWISFKHEIPRKTFTEKIVSNYPYNTVYIYQPVTRAL